MTTFTSSPTTQSPVEDVEEEKMDAFEFPPPSVPSSSQATKKTHRQTAFYPNMNSSNKLQKPFSRSAAKRESVMALGSIEHLQHYFTKTGIAAKKESLKENKGLVPAIGSLSNRPLRPSLGSIQEFHLPPSPAIPVFTHTQYPPVDKTVVDPEDLKPGVIRDLEAVSQSWGFDTKDNINHSDEKLDVLSALRLTTQLIRSVRNYCVSLPDDPNATQSNKHHFRPSSLQPVPTKRNVSNPNAASDPLARIRRSALDVLTVLRALEESTRLPLSDDAYDAQSDHLSSQDSRSPEPIHAVLGDDEQRSAPPQGHDVSFAISVVSVPGRSEAVPVWDDEDEDEFDNPGADVKREVWDERLVLGGGWLYQQNICLADLSNERSVIGRYLDAVDQGLFDGPSGSDMRGWERAARAEKQVKSRGSRSNLRKNRDDASPIRGNRSRAASPGIVDSMNNLAISEEAESPDQSENEDSVDDDDLPEWAKRNTFNDDPLARTHALLVSLLPVSLLPLLPMPYSSRIDLLTALSSGQLLCIAYNAGIRRSRKMWGYINKDAVHDIAALELKAEADDRSGEAAEKRKTGWTFRRTDNLRLWAAALKLRYLIPLTTPTSALPSLSSLSSIASSDSLTPSAPVTPTGTPSPVRTKFGGGTNDVPLIGFDAKLVARRDESWDTMLETVVLCWMRAVVDERRNAP